MDDSGDWEQRLRAAWAEEPPRLDGAVVLAEYDEGWPGLYEREAARIRGVLGDRVLLLEHIGSTSVPGLAAKPIIDIVLEVAYSANEADYAALLEEAGYRLRVREPEWHEHRSFKSLAKDVNLHVFSAGCAETVRMVTFRDWLRAHADDRELYARAKRDLAQRQWKYTQNYADAKTGVVEEILSRARAGSA